jgi:hypothetical protein
MRKHDPMQTALHIVSVVAALLMLFLVEQTIYAWQLHCPDKIYMGIVPRCVEAGK